jgi:hypothetical protein
MSIDFINIFVHDCRLAAVPYYLNNIEISKDPEFTVFECTA